MAILLLLNATVFSQNIEKGDIMIAGLTNGGLIWGEYKIDYETGPDSDTTDGFQAALTLFVGYFVVDGPGDRPEPGSVVPQVRERG
jgi:hypothetical protein